MRLTDDDGNGRHGNLLFTLARSATPEAEEGGGSCASKGAELIASIESRHMCTWEAGEFILDFEKNFNEQ